jgi:acyl-ACP thioesterase
MNNVVAWAAAEEEARRISGGRRPSWGQVEYRRPVERGETLTLISAPADGAVHVWLVGADGATAVSARLGWSGPSPLDLERHLA